MNALNRWLYGILMIASFGIYEISFLFAEDSLIDEIMKNIKSCQKEIEDIRGKKFKADVSVEVRSKEDFIKWARKLKDESSLQVEKTNKLFKVFALIKLGLIPSAGELVAEDLQKRADLVEQAAGATYDFAVACYIPIDKKVYIHKTGSFMEVKPFFIHELCHAMDDQYFDSITLQKNAGESDDAQIALEFLKEGTATYMMGYYAAKLTRGNKQPPSDTSIIQLLGKAIIETWSSQSLEDILNSERKKGQPPILRLDPKTTSRYLLWCKYAPYAIGTASVAEMTLMSVSADKGVSATGWAAVDLAWEKPPVSTEQMLHPHKLLAERDDPAPVNQPVPREGWEVVYSNALGEFGFRVLCETFEFKKQESLDFAAGWDGDRYALIKKDGRLALHFATIWDSEKDALESFKAYQIIIGAKYPDWQLGTIGIDFTFVTWTSPDAKSAVLMFRDGAKWTAVEDIPVEDMEFWQKNTPKKD